MQLEKVEVIMKYYRRLVIFAILAAILITSACEEKPNTTTMRLILSSPSSAREVIKPVGQGLAITSYAISGTGPNGNTFSITTNNAQVDINGLVIGTWTIDVVALNQQGTALATGSKTHHLTTAANVVEILVDTLVGTGSVSLGFSWAEPSFADVSLKIFLQAQGGEQQEITSGISVNPSAATALFEKNLAAGSYQLLYELYSGSTKIAGGIETLRIIDGALTSAEIPIIVDKETPEATGLTIASTITVPVKGSIEGLASSVLPNTPLSATFVYQEGGGSSDLDIYWYLDGEQIAIGPSVGFSTYTGAHRLDAVAGTELLGSIGSDSFPFRATVVSQQGVPVIIATISQGDRDPYAQPYRLANVTDTAFLRDGRLLIAGSSGLQLCEVIHDELVVVSNFTSTGGTVQTDPYPVNGVSDIIIDTVDDIVCTTARDLGIVAFYQYDSVSGDLEKIAAYDSNAGGWGQTITNMTIDRAHDMAFLVDRSTKKMHAIAYTSDTPLAYSPYNLPQIFAQIENPAELVISSNAMRLGLFCPSNRTFHTFILSYETSGTPRINIEHNSTLAADLGAGPAGLQIVGDKALVLLEDGLHVYGRTSGVIAWQYEAKVESLTGPMVDMAFDNLYGRAWTVSPSQVALLSLYSGMPVYEGRVSSGSFAGTRISSSPLGNLLSVIGDDALLLLRIADG